MRVYGLLCTEGRMIMATEVVNGFVSAVMVVCAVTDIKRKELSMKLFALLGIASLAGCILGQNKEIIMTVTGVIPGILLIVLAKITEQSIGYGDGIILAELGLFTGVGKCMLILAAALAMAGIFSLGIVVFKKVDKHYKIPFVPFLAIAFMISFFWER